MLTGCEGGVNDFVGEATGEGVYGGAAEGQFEAIYSLEEGDGASQIAIRSLNESLESVYVDLEWEFEGKEMMERKGCFRKNNSKERVAKNHKK